MYRKQYQSVAKHVCIHSSMSTHTCVTRIIYDLHSTVYRMHVRAILSLYAVIKYTGLSQVFLGVMCVDVYTQHTLVPLICSLLKMLRRKLLCLDDSNSCRHRKGTVNIKKKKLFIYPVYTLSLFLILIH